MMSVVSLFLDCTMRAARALLPAFAQSDLAWGLSREERLGLIFSAIDRCGADCPACAIWALEQGRSQTSWDAAPTERKQPC